MNLADIPEIYSYDNIPIQRDIIVIKGSDLEFFEAGWEWYIRDGINTSDQPNYILENNFCWIRERHQNYLDISLMINRSDRFHSSVHKLPKKKIIKCIHHYNYQKRPFLIVDDTWYNQVIGSAYSIFVLIDAIGVKDTLKDEGAINREQLQKFRKKLDSLARKNRKHLIFSFADSVIVKVNWKKHSVSGYEEEYDPEKLVEIIQSIQVLFMNILKFDSYAIMTQGLLDDHSSLLYKKSILGNHISMNSLGTPFAHLYEIEKQVRKNIKQSKHDSFNLYISGDTFLSLKLKTEFRQNIDSRKFTFVSDVTPGGDNWYFPTSSSEIIQKIDDQKLPNPLKWRFFVATYPIRAICDKIYRSYKIGGPRGIWRFNKHLFLKK